MVPLSFKSFDFIAERLSIIADMWRFLRSNQNKSMQISMLNPNGSNVHRITFLYRFILAVVAAHLITTGGEFQSFTELVKLRGYPIAMLSSLAIAMIVIEQVHYSTLKLQKRFPVYDLAYRKLSWQLLTCLLLPFLTIFGLATIYYAVHGFFILDTMWMTNHSWQVVLMLLVLNLVFSFPQAGSAPHFTVPEPKALTQPEARCLMYVLPSNGVTKVYYDDGTHNVDNRSLEDIFKLLDTKSYILNPKRSIVRVDNIKKIYKFPNGGLKLELFCPAGTLVSVSKRQSPAYACFF